jgi:hypothetical protein
MADPKMADPNHPSILMLTSLAAQICQAARLEVTAPRDDM